MKVIYAINTKGQYLFKTKEVKHKQESRDVIYQGSWYKKNKEFNLSDAKEIVRGGERANGKNDFFKRAKDEDALIVYIFDQLKSTWHEILMKTNRYQELVESVKPTLDNDFCITDDEGTIRRHYFCLSEHSDIINDERLDEVLPISLSYFPERMGISLESVFSISWSTQVKDKQIIDMNVEFVPQTESDYDVTESSTLKDSAHTFRDFLKY